MKNFMLKKVMPFFLAICMMITSIYVGDVNVNAAEVSAAGLKNYVADSVADVNAAMKKENIPLTAVVDNSQSLIKLYVTDKTKEAFSIIDNLSVLKGLFDYDGITTVKVDGIDMSKLGDTSNMLESYTLIKPILTKFGITLDNLDTYKLYDLVKANTSVEVVADLSNGESVSYKVRFLDYVTELEEYLSSAVTKINKELTSKVPMKIAVDNNTHKIAIQVTNLSYKLFNLASVDVNFLADIFGYDEIKTVAINGDVCAKLDQETLLVALINAYFPGTFPNGKISLDFGNPKVAALLSKTFNDLVGKPLTVKITLKTGESVTYTMSFVDAEPKCPTCGSKDHTTHPATPSKPSTPSNPTTVTYKGVVKSLKVSKKSTTYVSLKWTKPSSSFKAPAGYRVQYAVGKGKKTTKYTKKTSYTINKLSAGVVYGCTVTPYITDANGKKVYGKSVSVKGITKPKKVSLKVTGSKKAVKVSWKKVTATGYQVVLAKNNKFNKGVKKVTVSQQKKSSIAKTIGKLTKDKKYYVRVRAYTKSGSTISYGSWSSIKSAKTK